MTRREEKIRPRRRKLNAARCLVLNFYLLSPPFFWHVLFHSLLFFFLPENGARSTATLKSGMPSRRAISTGIGSLPGSSTAARWLGHCSSGSSRSRASPCSATAPWRTVKRRSAPHFPCTGTRRARAPGTTGTWWRWRKRQTPAPFFGCPRRPAIPSRPCIRPRRICCLRRRWRWWRRISGSTISWTRTRRRCGRSGCVVGRSRWRGRPRGRIGRRWWRRSRGRRTRRTRSVWCRRHGAVLGPGRCRRSGNAWLSRWIVSCFFCQRLMVLWGMRLFFF